MIGNFSLGLRSIFIFFIISLKLFASTELATANQTTIKSKKPNIIIILADDLGWSDIGSYGSEIKTPNLDGLAKTGIRFTQFSNTSKCFTSRASLLTGQYQHSVGLATSSKKPLVHDVTIADLLKQAGYRTLMVGKHHGIDNPYDLGFDHYSGLRDGASNHFNPGNKRKNEPEPAQKRPGLRSWCFDSKCIQPYTPTDPNFYSTDAYTDWALELLKNKENNKNPFFLYLSYTAPHDPLQAWPKDIAKYKDVYSVGYQNIADARRQRLLDSGLIDASYVKAKPTFTPWQELSVEDQKDQAHRMAVYAGMIDRMDQNIGRLLNHLRKSDQFNNTLIIFMSDNGSSHHLVDIGSGDIGNIDRWASLGESWANVSNTPFRLYKNYSHQGGIATPVVVSWPSGLVKADRVSSYPGHFIDFMPTLLQISGAKYPETIRSETIYPMPGESFLPILQNKTLKREKPLFWQWKTGKGVRMNNWKLVATASKYSAVGGGWELYDMSIDKTETNNLATKYPEKVTELEKLYTSWYQHVSEQGK